MHWSMRVCLQLAIRDALVILIGPYPLIFINGVIKLGYS